MIVQTLKLDNKNGFNFDLIFYQRAEISKQKQQNPLMLIFAGGSFTSLSKREQEPIALKYLSEGFNVALVNYNLLTQNVPLFPNAALCGFAAIEHFRTNMQEYHINANQIITAGFSAGGAVVGIMNSIINDSTFLQKHNLDPNKIKPNGSILGYPLLELASLKAPYPPSFQQWVPSEPFYQNANLGVGSLTPPTFLFHTANDDLVPVSNTLNYAQTLNKYHIPFEVHIYPMGVHGIATARKISATDRTGEINPSVATWMSLSLTWLELVLSISSRLN
ncbi:alpha/beta hydrolase [Enterococcus sp. DIV0800]|uniref:alpha/beta hydrolase n=1 Tax=unclassified Enterococcus TaxID=2608891 RepID=UPI003D2FDB67